MLQPEDLENNEISGCRDRSEIPYNIGWLTSEDQNSLKRVVVFEATGKETGEAVAVKRINLSGKNTRDSQRVARECGILRRLNHPNILRFKDAYYVHSEASIYLIATPWVPITLLDFIESIGSNGVSNKCPWYSSDSPTPILHIMRRLLEALHYLHADGVKTPIKHKDIKPDNILLKTTASKPYVEPIIIDFGISKEITSMHTTNECYTYMYRPPEQAAGEQTTPKSDVYCLGCVFALIEGILLDGRRGVRTVYDKAQAESACFANNFAIIHRFLDNQVIGLRLHQSPLAEFHEQLRVLVKGMVEPDLFKRLDIVIALHNYLYIESLLNWNDESTEVFTAQTSEFLLKQREIRAKQDEFMRKILERARDSRM